MTDHYFYVDRTHLLPHIEEAGRQLLFLRPRRFGKSLLLSMLENYYDVAKAEEFEKLFGQLAIGKTPTPKHNQYLVMKWDFSMVKATGDPEQIQQALYDHLNDCIQAFQLHYRELLTYQIVCNTENAVSSFHSLLMAVSQTPYRLYLLIDEYDNFANELLMGSRTMTDRRYQTLLSGEGVLKTLFKAVKAARSGRGLERVFITGVSPVVLSDFSSGYNVAENIYLRPEFNDLCGFQEMELAAVVTQVVHDCQLPPDQATNVLAMMRTFYNGYCFCYVGTPLVYNPTLALYFLKNFQSEGRPPRELLDDNLAMDAGKLACVAALPGGDELLVEALNDAANDAASWKLPKLANRFGVADLLTATQDPAYFVSLLYYFGVLTLTGETPEGYLRFTIPNLVIRQLYAERLLEQLLPARPERQEALRVVESFCQPGNLQSLCDFVERRCLKVFDNRDSPSAHELTVKAIFLALFSPVEVFYLMESETALQRRYADLTLIVRAERCPSPLWDVLLEFKYVKLAKVKRKGPKVKQLSQVALKQLTPVQQQLAAAHAQLTSYRQTLQAKYGGVLRLHCYGVVAVCLSGAWDAPYSSGLT